MRRLILKSETLADLTGDEMSSVAGGATQLCPTRQATLCYLCALTPPDVITLTQSITEQTCTW